MEGGDKNELKKTTIGLMVAVALFFDFLQWALAFIFMDWLVGPFAFMTFYVWMRMHGIKFSSAKRAGTMLGAFIIEFIPVVAMLPAWTGAITVMVLDQKAKKITSSVGASVPGGAAAPAAPSNRSAALGKATSPAAPSAGGSDRRANAAERSNVVPFPAGTKAEASKRARPGGNVDSLSKAA